MQPSYTSANKFKIEHTCLWLTEFGPLCRCVIFTWIQDNLLHVAVKWLVLLYFGGLSFKACDTVQLIQFPSVFFTFISCSCPPDIFDSHITIAQVIENYVILCYLLLMIIDVFWFQYFPYAAVHSSVSSSLPTQARISSSAPFSQIPSACAFPQTWAACVKQQAEL